MLFQMFQGRELSKAKSMLNYLYVGIALSLSNPIDFIRFRMQTMPELIKQGLITKPYNSVLDCARRVSTEQGGRAFWKGNVSNLLKFYPAEALNWIFKEIFQSTYRRLTWGKTDEIHENFAINYLGGASAGLLTRTILYPLQYTRNKMNNQINNKNSGIVACLREAIQKQGIRGLYRGAMISFFGVSIFRSTYFGIYDTFKDKTESAMERWFLSYLGVFCSILLTYPMDTVRRRMMMTTCQSYKYKGFRDCSKKIFGVQGLKGFFRGAPMIFFQSITGATIYFMFDKIIRDLKEMKY